VIEIDEHKVKLIFSDPMIQQIRYKVKDKFVASLNYHKGVWLHDEHQDFIRGAVDVGKISVEFYRRMDHVIGCRYIVSTPDAIYKSVIRTENTIIRKNEFTFVTDLLSYNGDYERLIEYALSHIIHNTMWEELLPKAVTV